MAERSIALLVALAGLAGFAVALGGVAVVRWQGGRRRRRGGPWRAAERRGGRWRMAVERRDGEWMAAERRRDGVLAGWLDRQAAAVLAAGVPASADAVPAACEVPPEVEALDDRRRAALMRFLCAAELGGEAAGHRAADVEEPGGSAADELRQGHLDELRQARLAELLERLRTLQAEVGLGDPYATPAAGVVARAWIAAVAPDLDGRGKGALIRALAGMGLLGGPGGLDLAGADLRGAEAGGANLGGARLAGADLRGSDLRGCDLRAAILDGADLRRARLQCATLCGASLRRTRLEGADLTGARGAPVVADGRVIAALPPLSA